MNRILIISSSSRALTDSADRAGFSFDVFDQFHDWDLRQICDRKPENQNQILTPADFKELVETVDGSRYCGAVVAGGFEMRLSELEILDHRMQLLGPSIETLRRLQSTDSLDCMAECTLKSGGKWPTTFARSSARLPMLLHQHLADEGWLVKDLKGSGGSHVRSIAIDHLVSPCSLSNFSGSEVIQERICGRSISALYLSPSNQPNRLRCQPEKSWNLCQLIGCTKQLVGVKELGANEFSYCGSVGPIPLDQEQQKIIAQIGQNIVDQFSIVGIFGIDFILNEEGIWPVDINPRITASAEIFEIHRHINDLPPFSVFSTHLAACSGEMLRIETFPKEPALPKRADFASRLSLAKGILFCGAESGLKISKQIFDRLLSINAPHTTGAQRRSRPSLFIADIPERNSSISRGAPILTIFESGETPQEAEWNLLESARSLTNELY